MRVSVARRPSDKIGLYYMFVDVVSGNNALILMFATWKSNSLKKKFNKCSYTVISDSQ